MSCCDESQSRPFDPATMPIPAEAAGGLGPEPPAQRAPPGYGPRLADEQTVTARLAICETCPSRVVSVGAWWCGTPFLPSAAAKTCGCVVAIKARLSQQHCPQSKW